MTDDRDTGVPEKTFWEDAATIPNLVSFIRLMGIPYFWYVLIGQERIGFAALLIFLIASTDWLDGYLARRLNQVSEVGKALDPLADRLMIASAIIGGWMVGVVPVFLAVGLLVREAIVAGAAIYLGLVHRTKIAVRTLGKTATFLVYGSLPSFYLVAADIWKWFFAPPAWIGGVTGLILYYWVALSYLKDTTQRARGA